MNEQMMKDIPNWEKEYLTMNGQLSKRQIELLNGAEIKSHEGMVFGGMYADWKNKKVTTNASINYHHEFLGFYLLSNDSSNNYCCYY